MVLWKLKTAYMFATDFAFIIFFWHIFLNVSFIQVFWEVRNDIVGDLDELVFGLFLNAQVKKNIFGSLDHISYRDYADM